MMNSPETQFVANELAPRIPNIVVVDARFDAYKQLAQSERLGRLNLHFRTSGAEAIRLARHQRVDAWLIATDLDDMSGNDLVELLQQTSDSAGRQVGKVALVSTKKTSARQSTIAEWESLEMWADAVLSHPISLSDIEEILGVNHQARQARPHNWFPIAVGATVISIALLIMG